MQVGAQDRTFGGDPEQGSARGRPGGELGAALGCGARASTLSIGNSGEAKGTDADRGSHGVRQHRT